MDRETLQTSPPRVALVDPMEGNHRGGETQEERARRMEKAVEVIEAPGEQEVPLAKRKN